jgi:hypothetical protein
MSIGVVLGGRFRGLAIGDGDAVSPHDGVRFSVQCRHAFLCFTSCAAHYAFMRGRRYRAIGVVPFCDRIFLNLLPDIDLA